MADHGDLRTWFELFELGIDPGGTDDLRIVWRDAVAELDRAVDERLLRVRPRRITGEVQPDGRPADDPPLFSFGFVPHEGDFDLTEPPSRFCQRETVRTYRRLPVQCRSEVSEQRLFVDEETPTFFSNDLDPRHATPPPGFLARFAVTN